MTFIELNCDQLSRVSGGNGCRELDSRSIKDHLNSRFTDIGMGEEQINDCLDLMLCGDNCITRCIPEKKPERCAYESWGRIHNLDEGTLKKCRTVDPSKVIK